MNRYLVKLTPLGKYFFGGDMTFKSGRKGDNDDEKYMQMIKEPAMRENYDFNGYEKLEKFLNNIIAKGNMPLVRQRNKFVRFYERYAPIRDKGMHKILYIFGIKIKVG